jgi:hypothetical protein
MIKLGAYNGKIHFHLLSKIRVHFRTNLLKYFGNLIRTLDKIHLGRVWHNNANIAFFLQLLQWDHFAMRWQFNQPSIQKARKNTVQIQKAENHTSSLNGFANNS